MSITQFPKQRDHRIVANQPVKPQPTEWATENTVWHYFSKTGYPIGKHGPVRLLWVKPAAMGVSFLANVEELNSAKALSLNDESALIPLR